MGYVCRNLRWVAPLAVVQLTGYSLLNHHPPFPPRTLPLTALDHWIPFWTWTVWLYFLLIAMAIVLPLLVREADVFRRMLVAYAMAMGTAGAFFLLWPSYYRRPPWPLDDSVHAQAYRWLTLVDAPCCCFPSSHVIVPILACAGLLREGRRGARLLALCMAVCTLSILTTKQHYLWDWLGGWALALAASALAGLLRGGRLLQVRSLTGKVVSAGLLRDPPPASVLPGNETGKQPPPRRNKGRDQA